MENLKIIKKILKKIKNKIIIKKIITENKGMENYL